MRTRTPPPPRTAGFTLIEIMIVLAIILAMFGFLIGPRVYHSYRQSQCKNTLLEMGTINGAIVQYQANNDGKCPGSVEELKSAGLIDKTTDQWGQPFLLVCPGQVHTDGFDLSSAGPDKKPGTADDLVFGADNVQQECNKL